MPKTKYEDFSSMMWDLSQKTGYHYTIRPQERVKDSRITTLDQVLFVYNNTTDTLANVKDYIAHNRNWPIIVNRHEYFTVEDRKAKLKEWGITSKRKGIWNSIDLFVGSKWTIL